MSKISNYATKVRKALKAAGKYSRALDLQIYTIATALCTLEKATAEILDLDSVTVETPQGIKAHPAFKIQHDAQDSVTRQMKALGLRCEDIDESEENNPLFDLSAAVRDQLNS